MTILETHNSDANRPFDFLWLKYRATEDYVYPLFFYFIKKKKLVFLIKRLWVFFFFKYLFISINLFSSTAHNICNEDVPFRNFVEHLTFCLFFFLLLKHVSYVSFPYRTKFLAHFFFLFLFALKNYIFFLFLNLFLS